MKQKDQNKHPSAEISLQPPVRLPFPETNLAQGVRLLKEESQDLRQNGKAAKRRPSEFHRLSSRSLMCRETAVMGTEEGTARKRRAAMWARFVSRS